jgi:hypothetical protein
MRALPIVLLSIFISFLPFCSMAQDTIITQKHSHAIDTSIVKSAGTNTQQPDDEFNLFLLAFALAGMCFIAACFFVGVIAAIAIVGLTILLISAGIISTSFFIGWYKRSFSTGFKLFWTISGSICGLLFGAVTFGVIAHVAKLQLTTTTASLSGGAIGLITGGLVGYMVYKLLRVGFKYVATKFKLLTEKMMFQQ